MELNKYTVTAIACSALAVIINTVSYFFLPETILTQISLSGQGEHTPTLTALIIITSLILISSGMIFFTDRKSKWITVTLILFLINIMGIAVNLLNLV